mmetsp:Transcript_41802/g.87748  ORF Transcript_41802/g.87748 Transcript_41802/m.87748 type:complete len:384 (-) Transcript_41802:1437-2588(-)
MILSYLSENRFHFYLLSFAALAFRQDTQIVNHVFACSPQKRLRLVYDILLHDQYHPNTAVKRPEHFMIVQTTHLFHPAKDVREGWMSCDLCADIGRQTTRQVLEEAAPSDMCETGQHFFLKQREAALDVELRGGQERIPDSSSVHVPRTCRFIVQIRLLHQLPDQTESIAVYSAAWQSKQNISRCHIFRQYPVLVNSPHAEPSQVIIPGRVHGRHLGCLPANEPAARPSAPLGNAPHNGSSLLNIQLSGGKVIQEEQRLSASDNEVVDAHGDKIDSHRLMLFGHVCHAEFGPNAICGADDDGIFRIVPRRGQVEETAESAKVGVASRPTSGFASRFDELHKRVPCIDTYSRVGVADGVFTLLLNCLNEGGSLKCLDLGFERFG